MQHQQDKSHEKQKQEGHDKQKQQSGTAAAAPDVAAAEAQAGSKGSSTQDVDKVGRQRRHAWAGGSSKGTSTHEVGYVRGARRCAGRGEWGDL